MPAKIQRQKATISRASGNVKRIRATIKKPDEPRLESMFEDTDNNPLEFDANNPDFQVDVNRLGGV